MIAISNARGPSRPDYCNARAPVARKTVDNEPVGPGISPSGSQPAPAEPRSASTGRIEVFVQDDMERDWNRLVFAVLAAVLCVLGLLAASSAALATPAPPGAGTMQLRMADGPLVEAPWLDTQMQVDISGMVARVTVRQQFQNAHDAWVEGVYIFPLPENAAVDRMRLRVGDRLIEGEIQPREQAQRTYEQARENGQRASLVEQERSNVFTTSVANIGPFEAIDVEIEYQQILTYDDSLGFELRLPMTATPKFVGADAQGATLRNAAMMAVNAQNANVRVPDAPRITHAVLHSAQDYRAMASVQIALDAGFALSRLESAHHQLRVQRAGTRMQIALADEKVAMDRDFVLRWAPERAGTPDAAVFTEQLDGYTYVMMMLMPPAQEVKTPAPPREMIFVIDTSGSMQGESIKQAREAVQLAIGRLTPRDRFNVIEFNSDADALYHLPVPLDGTTREQGVSFVQALQADGGTNMQPALELALYGAAPAGYLRQVVFVTDGAVGDGDHLFSLLQQQLGDARLFTVGIGSAPNGRFMRKAAQFGRGTFTYIGDMKEVAVQMDDLFAKLESPALTDIALEWPSDAQMWPARVPDLYAGEPVVVTARLAQGSGPVRVTGLRAGAGYEATLDLTRSESHPGVAALWARRKIEAVMDAGLGGRDLEQVRREVIDIALRHQLVSRHTSLVAVDRTPVRLQNAVLKTAAVPSLLPAGSQTAAFPATATEMPVKLFAAVLFALCGVQLRRLSVRALA